MSTLTGAAYQRPHFARATMSNSLAHPSRSIQPIAGPLKPIPHMHVKPHVPPIRQQMIRKSEQPIVLPKLHTPGRNRSQATRTDLLSPIRVHGGSLSVRNGPSQIINEARRQPSLPPNLALKNYTALELSRFIDKRLTDVSKSHINYNRQGGGGTDDRMIMMGDDQQGMQLRAKMFTGAGRKALISNMTNFRDIENPFSDYSLTLQTIKKEKHEAWKVRKAEKSLKLKSQIADMEKKLDIYRKYKDELGVTLNKKERDKVLKQYDSTGVEILIGRKMFSIRQVEAAVRIQSWWRMTKHGMWYNLVRHIRHDAAIRIQRLFRSHLHHKVMPEMTKVLRNEAAITIQKYLKGCLVKSKYSHEIQLQKMNNCFDYFSDIQRKIEDHAVRVITYHMKKYSALQQHLRRQEEQELAKIAKLEKKNSQKQKTTPTNAVKSTFNKSIGRSNNQSKAGISSSKTIKEKESGALKKSTDTKSDSVFMTGVKKSENNKSKDNLSIHQKSGDSLKHQKSGGIISPEKQLTEKMSIEFLDKEERKPISGQNDVNKSFDEVRMQNSPLEVHNDNNNQTQVLKISFNQEQSVIHEIQEEHEPETNRHSILKKDKGGFQEGVAKATEQLNKTSQVAGEKGGFQEGVAKAEQLNKTSQVVAPANFTDKQKEVMKDFNSTGGVTVNNLDQAKNTQEEIEASNLELMNTVQAQAPQNVTNDGENMHLHIVSPPETQSQADGDEKSMHLRDSQVNMSQEERGLHVAQNFSQDKISLGVNDQPVSQSMIPGKLNDEQQLDQATLGKLNQESEMGSVHKDGGSNEGEPIRDSAQSLQLRQSKKSGVKSQVQKSQETSKLPKMRISQATGSVASRQSAQVKNKQMAQLRSSAQQQSFTSAKSKKSGAVSPPQSPKKSIAANSKHSGGKSPAKTSMKKSQVMTKSKEFSQAAAKATHVNDDDEVARENGIASRQSVKELVEKRRNEDPNHEKDDKFSDYNAQSSEEAPQLRVYDHGPPDASKQSHAMQQSPSGATNGQGNDEGGFDDDFSNGDGDNNGSDQGGRMAQNESGMLYKVDEKGQKLANQGRYDDPSDSHE